MTRLIFCGREPAPRCLEQGGYNLDCGNSRIVAPPAQQVDRQLVPCGGGQNPVDAGIGEVARYLVPQHDPDPDRALPRRTSRPSSRPSRNCPTESESTGPSVPLAAVKRCAGPRGDVRMTAKTVNRLTIEGRHGHGQAGGQSSADHRRRRRYLSRESQPRKPRPRRIRGWPALAARTRRESVGIEALH